MTGIYKTGTITLNSNSNIVTGTGTLFQSVANPSVGDLFSLDGKEFFEIYQVDTETQLRIRNLVTGAKYLGPSVAGVNYAIVRNFAASTDAQIASDVVNLQQRWHEREREMTEWFASDANYHQITDIRGDKVLVITPTGLNRLVDGPVNVEDFGFPSARESQALDLNDFPAGIFYTRALHIAHQPPGFGAGVKLVITNRNSVLFYQKIIELSSSEVRYRIGTSPANAELWNALGGETDAILQRLEGIEASINENAMAIERLENYIFGTSPPDINNNPLRDIDNNLLYDINGNLLMSLPYYELPLRDIDNNLLYDINGNLLNVLFQPAI